MDFTPMYNKHYIHTNERGEIICGFSDAFRQPSDGDICINEQGGYQFRLPFPNSTEENPPLFDGTSMIPLYKWDGAYVIRRTDEELAADRSAYNAEQTRLNRIAELHRLLNSTDYIAAKIAEGVATKEEYADQLAQRQSWRDEINELEGSEK